MRNRTVRRESWIPGSWDEANRHGGREGGRAGGQAGGRDGGREGGREGEWTGRNERMVKEGRK